MILFAYVSTNYHAEVRKILVGANAHLMLRNEFGIVNMTDLSFCAENLCIPWADVRAWWYMQADILNYTYV